MGRFANETTVPVERSRAEVEGLLVRYGASEFHSGWTDGKAMIAFRLKDIFIRFVLPIPAKSDKRFWWKVVRGHPRALARGEGRIRSRPGCCGRTDGLGQVVSRRGVGMGRGRRSE